MTAEIHLIHRDFKKDLKSYGSGRLPSFAVGSLYPPINDEVMFGGRPGGDMAETTNEVGPVSEGLTVEDLLRAKEMLSANDGYGASRPVEWATPDKQRFLDLIMKDTSVEYLKSVSKEDLRPYFSMAFAGCPLVLDEALPADVLVEIRDQHGNSLGRIMAS